MARVMVRNGHVIDPSQSIDEVMDILIEDGKIIEIGCSISQSVERVIEARGLLVIPGLVDMHVHLRDPGFTKKEDIFTGCNAAVSGGVTSLLCMPNTNPPIDNPETIEYIQTTATRARAHVYICACATKGMKGEELADYTMYSSMGVKAISDDGRPIEDDGIMGLAMKAASESKLLAISHCEDLAIIDGGIMHKGSVSEALGVPGMDRLSEDSITARELYLAQQDGGAIHIAHVSTATATDLVREGKRRGIRVTAETCPHYFAYTHDKLKGKDADYRMNPPLREQEDVDAIIAGIRDGTFDCIVTDHAPHTKLEKENFDKAPNGVVGLETSLSAGIKFLVEPGHITMYRLVELMSTAPAKLLGINAGSLAVGMPADIAIVNPDVEWTVLPERLNSKSRNSAFKFEKLKGRVKYTLVGGEMTYVQRY